MSSKRKATELHTECISKKAKLDVPSEEVLIETIASGTNLVTDVIGIIVDYWVQGITPSLIDAFGDGCIKNKFSLTLPQINKMFHKYLPAELFSEDISRSYRDEDILDVATQFGLFPSQVTYVHFVFTRFNSHWSSIYYPSGNNLATLITYLKFSELCLRIAPEKALEYLALFLFISCRYSATNSRFMMIAFVLVFFGILEWYSSNNMGEFLKSPYPFPSYIMEKPFLCHEVWSGLPYCKAAQGYLAETRSPTQFIKEICGPILDVCGLEQKIEKLQALVDKTLFVATVKCV